MNQKTLTFEINQMHTQKCIVMMKAIRKMTLVFLLGTLGVTFTGCFGQFQLTRSVYSWNESVTNDKFAQTLLFYGMNIIPVYSAAGFLDFVFFNVLEFWTGSNPIAMAGDEIETQLVFHLGKWYELTAEKNQFTISVVNGSDVDVLYAINFIGCQHQFDVAAQPIPRDILMASQQ